MSTATTKSSVWTKIRAHLTIGANDARNLAIDSSTHTLCERARPELFVVGYHDRYA